MLEDIFPGNCGWRTILKNGSDNLHKKYSELSLWHCPMFLYSKSTKGRQKQVLSHCFSSSTHKEAFPSGVLWKSNKQLKRGSSNAQGSSKKELSRNGIQNPSWL